MDGLRLVNDTVSNNLFNLIFIKMAFKIYTEGNYFFLEDTVIGTLYEGLSKDVLVRRGTATSQSFAFQNLNQWSNTKLINFTEIQDKAGAAYSSLAVFVAFYVEKTGKSSGGASSIPTQDIFHGGIFDYNDLLTTTTPISVTQASSPVPLTNDGQGAFTNKLFAPVGVDDVWNASTGSFDWTKLKLGDMVDIRLDFNLITTSVNTEINVGMHLGIGASEYVIPFVPQINFKSTGTHKINRYNGVYMGDTNTLNNGSVFKISADKSCSVVVNGWYCKIIRKG